jgi:GTP cyclohydrolase IA
VKAERRVFDPDRAEAAIRELLLAVGEDPERDGLKDTPKRVARSYRELLGGYLEDPGAHLERQFTIDRDIPFSSMCEHHMLPFMGRAHVAYLPGTSGSVCGLSKIARLVDGFARRLQVQERLTGQIADELMTRLGAGGALVVLEAEHLCMTIRGAMKPGATTTTSAVRGLLNQQSSRAEALTLIRG